MRPMVGYNTQWIEAFNPLAKVVLSYSTQKFMCKVAILYTTPYVCL